VGILVPLYSKRIITAFRPPHNGETNHYGITAHDTFDAYLNGDGLNIHALLNKYRQYVRRRGFKAFDTDNLKEAAWHYSLDGFINFFVEDLEGHTFIEVPSGAGPTDLLIVYNKHRYLIEIKVFSTQTRFKKGKAQLAEYLKSEGLDEGHYVVFSNLHTDDDVLYFEENIKGKQIYTYIICTHFPTPSRVPVPEALKKTDSVSINEARAEGSLMTRRRDILDILVLRFDPPASRYQQIEQRLLTVSLDAQLKTLLAAAVQSEELSAFQSVMENIQ